MDSRLRKYIGIPFCEYGRGPDSAVDLLDFSERQRVEGMDCYGLVWHFHKHELGIDLPRFDGVGTKRSDLAKIVKAAGDAMTVFRPVECGGEQIGDVIRIVIEGHDWHTGLWSGYGKFVHVMQGISVVEESYKSSKWAQRFGGVYRYVG